MKPTKNKLRALRIFNSWDIAKRSSKVFVGYRPQQTGRAWQSAAWQVHHTSRPTDPKAHFLDYGAKTFSVYRRGEKQEKLAEAQKWATEKFGFREWERDPWGDYHPKGSITIAIESAKATQKAGA